MLGEGVTDFRLPDAISETEIALSGTLIEHNVVLVFYRAFW
jgi:peroxiredoxin